MTSFITVPRKDKFKCFEVAIGTHFRSRFVERWGHQDDIIEYLNTHLTKGYFIKDIVTDNGIYFPNAGIYVPLTIKRDKPSMFFAITFQFKSVRFNSNRTRKVIWSKNFEGERANEESQN